MAKSKTKDSKKAQPVAEPTSRVKAGGVTKSKDTAKDAAKAVVKNVKAAKETKELKKKKKQPEPEPESESSESESSASESGSSDSESEEEVTKKDTKKPAAAAKAKKESSDSESESDSDSETSSEEEPKKAAVNGKAKAKAQAKSESESESDSDSESETEEEKAAVKETKVNGAAKKGESSDSSDSDSDSESEESDEKPTASAETSNDSEDESSDSSSEESEEVEKAAPVSKKRKAEDDADASSKKSKSSNENAAPTLFVGSLAWAVDDDILYKAFESFEGLTNARVVTDKNTGRSRGFGYVDFSDSDAATKAYEAMQGKELEGRALNLDFANARPAESNPQARAADRAQKHGDSVSAESDTLFVGNLPFGVDQDTVKDFFAEVRPVSSVRLPTDPESGELKGFGYVSFGSVEDAKAVLNEKNGASIGEGRSARSIRLDFASARPPRDGAGGGGRGGFGGRGGGRGGGGRGGGGRGGGRGRGGPRGGGRGGFSSANRTSYSGTKVTFD